MYILGIETTGAFASVALLKDDKIIGHISGNDRFSHLQNLMPQVDVVIRECKLSIGDVDAIAVSRGPGSFTGIRIGVSTARALAQILDIPCVPVSSLEALAMRAAESNSFQNGDSGAGGVLICPMLDARRSQIYAGGYFLRDGFPQEEIEAGPYMLDEFLAKAALYERVLLLGDAVDAYGGKIREMRPAGTETAPESIRYQDAAFTAKHGAALFRKRGGLAYHQVEPDYMRMAEAERKLREGTLQQNGRQEHPQQEKPQKG